MRTYNKAALNALASIEGSGYAVAPAREGWDD